MLSYDLEPKVQVELSTMMYDWKVFTAHTAPLMSLIIILNHSTKNLKDFRYICTLFNNTEGIADIISSQKYENINILWIRMYVGWNNLVQRQDRGTQETYIST